MKGTMGFLFFAAPFFHVVLAQGTVAPFFVPAVFVFGDSTVDVGNNNFLPGQQSKANFPHNGIDFTGGKATGRFSNGYNAVDFLAMSLGLDKSPPAYLTMNKEFEEYRGANFASGGSGILDVTGHDFSIPLNQQINNYRKFRESVKNRVGSFIANPYLHESIFIFSTGNNDMFEFLVTFGLQNVSQQGSFVDKVATQFKVQLQTVYSLGAKKFVVFGLSPLGCVPWLRKNMPDGECIEGMNNLIQKFNKAIQNVLSSLVYTLEGFSYSFINTFDVISVVSSQPQKYGFADISSACCGSGKLKAESSCTPNATYCSDRNHHFFWDRVHPTQATSKLIASAAFQGRKYATPVTVEKLAQLSVGK